MRGIPNSAGSGAGFLKASPLARSFGGNASQRSLASRREGGIKLLDISEQPVGAREAKRRRKIAGGMGNNLNSESDIFSRHIMKYVVPVA